MSEPTSACPHCETKIRIKDPAMVGRKVRCPKCSETFTIALSAPSQATAAKSAAASTAKPASAGGSGSRKSSAAATAGAAGPAKSAARPGHPAKGSKPAQKRAAAKAPASDDDWLNDLDGLDDTAEVATPAGPPPVAGKKRKKKGRGKGPRPSDSFWRDEDGDLSLAAHRLLMIGTGFLGGALATAVWAGIIYRTGMPVRYVAIVAGGMVGSGVRLGASKWDYGLAPAITSCIITFLAIISGTIFGVMMSNSAADARVAKLVAEAVPEVSHENYNIDALADTIEYQWVEEGKLSEEELWNLQSAAVEETEDVAWDVGETVPLPKPEDLPKEHPPAVWEEATRQWRSKTDEERETIARENDAARREAAEDMAEYNVPRGGGFGPLDLICLGVAMFAAFKIAAGWTDEE